MQKKVLLKFAILSGILLVVPAFVSADAGIMSATAVYFEKNGKPHERPVDFTINCYGKYEFPMPGVPAPEPTPSGNEKIFTVSASCPEYGCKFYEAFYLKGAVISQCDLEGKTEGQDFKIENYAQSPVDYEKCTPTPPPYDEMTIDDAGNWIYTKNGQVIKKIPAGQTGDPYQIDPDFFAERECSLRFEMPANVGESGDIQKMGIWQRIVCFFKRLFGGSC